MAKDFDRARSLRRYMEKIAASNTAPPELIYSLALLAFIAHCFDPLVTPLWPEVDTIGGALSFKVPLLSCDVFSHRTTVVVFGDNLTRSYYIVTVTHLLLEGEGLPQGW